MHNPDALAERLYQFNLAGCPGVPEDLCTALCATTSPANHAHIAVVMAAEAIYANRDRLPVEALSLGADLAECAGLCGLGGLNQDARGVRIASALRAMPGVSTPEAAPAGDPEPLASAAVAAPTEEVTQ
jgi:hypothetical protein